MKKGKNISLLLLFYIFAAGVALIILSESVYSQKLTIEQRLEKIETRLIVIEKDITILKEKISVLQTQFYFLYILLAAIIGLIGVMVNAVMKFTKEERPIGQRQYERILAREDLLEEEINKLKKEIQLRIKPANPET